MAVVHIAFCIAALLNTLLPRFDAVFGALNHMGKLGLTVTLFLIGASLNRETLRKVGFGRSYRASRCGYRWSQHAGADFCLTGFTCEPGCAHSSNGGRQMEQAANTELSTNSAITP